MASLEAMSADPSRPLHNQKAPVAGDSSGTGAGCGFALDGAVAPVVINNYFDADEAGRVTATTWATTGDTIAIQADANSEKQVQAMFAETTGRFGE